MNDKPLAVLVGLLLVLCRQAYPASAPRWEDIAGYQVDMTRTPRARRDETTANLKHQLSIVETVELPAPVRSFFRSLKIVIDPTLSGMNGQNNQIGGEWVILARPGQWPSDRAILLHEFMHAYQREVLGRPTPAIGRAYQEGLREGTYPPAYKGEYFLSNGPEYFAVISEIFLAGPSFRPPYNCATVQKAQPDFIRYLAGLFGERECR